MISLNKINTNLCSHQSAKWVEINYLDLDCECDKFVCNEATTSNFLTRTFEINTDKL